MKRVPSFSHRPGFPKGLQVVLVESDSKARRQVESQLEALSYVVTACTSCADAARKIGSRSSVGFELVLVEAQTITRGAPDCSLFLSTVRGLPLVLMSDSSNKSDILRGIELGAVDFLEKPLSSLKLKNIWQHVVRKMMTEDVVIPFMPAEVAVNSPVKDEDEEASGCGVTSAKMASPAGSGAEKGSITFSTRSKGSEEESSNTALGEDDGRELQLKESTSSSGLRKQGSFKGRRKVKPIKPVGASVQPPPLAVRPPGPAAFSHGFAGPTYAACEGWPQLLQQPGAWGQQCGGPAFTFVPTPTSTPTPSPDQGSMPFSYPRRPVLPAFCSAWHIPTQVQLPQLCGQAQQLGARCKSAPSESSPREEFKALEPCRSLDASLDASIDSVLDSDPLCLAGDSDLFESDFGDIFGSAEAPQHNVFEAAAKLEALVAPEKASAGLPFGLRLKKSESFCNLINRHLAETRASVSASQ
ncbi:hypothetical protein WJX74_003274 [Apatococcus lobatus]|uniref:Response regulatory domain-containing protein n=2 Tax=Apatococcus TaxID=904362 RepID=A0AAW1RHZ8_9CHLO